MQPIPYWRLSGFYFFHFAFIGAFAPYWSLYLKSLSFNAFQIGMLMSLLHVTRIFAPAAWGWLADHTGKRLLIVQLAAITGSDKLLRCFFWRVVCLAVRNHGADEFLLERIFAADRSNHAFLSRESTAKYGRIRVWGSVGFIFAVISVGYLAGRQRILPRYCGQCSDSSWVSSFFRARFRRAR